MHVFNSVYAKTFKDTKSKKKAETRAFKSANNVIKRRIEKFGSFRYGHDSVFNCAVDKWLGILKENNTGE